MKSILPMFALAMAAFSGNSYSDGPIYHCDNNLYTNTLLDAKTKGCKVMVVPNVTVVPGTKPAARAAGPSAASSGAQRVNSTDQKARDSDVRQILESELRKALTRQAELIKEYNNGEPEKQGSEARNYQKYLDRVAEVKASLARTESDIAGLRRELGRLGNTAALPPSK